MDNFRSSVTAELNTDASRSRKRPTIPTARSSVRCARPRKPRSPSRASRDKAATVEQNIPQAAPNRAAPAPQSSDQSDKKEEQTNYEINSKTTATVRNSYKVEKLSVAVVVNKGRIAKMVGEPPTRPRSMPILPKCRRSSRRLPASTPKRGDVDHRQRPWTSSRTSCSKTPPAGPGVMDMLSRNLAGIINSLAFVLVAFLIVWMGFRPLIRSVNGTAVAAAFGDTTPETAGLELPDFAPAVATVPAARLWMASASDFGFDSTDDLL